MKRIIVAAVLIGLMTFDGTAPTVAQNKGTDFKVTLLGTGTPLPLMQRFGPGILVQAGGKNQDARARKLVFGR